MISKKPLTWFFPLMFVYVLLWEEYKYSIGGTNKCSDSNFVKSIMMSINGSTSNIRLLLKWSRYIFFALNYKLLLLWQWWWHDLDRFKDHLLKRDLFLWNKAIIDVTIAFTVIYFTFYFFSITTK